MSFISYAQNGEDVLLNRVFAGVEEGFYVDIGAYDPVEGSVTKAFSDRGWTGINVEPGAVFDRLAVARPRDVNLRLAVIDRSGTVAFVQHAVDAGMSHVTQNSELPADGVIHEVPCDTLTAILGIHAPERAIDFLKIDAEGAEMAIVGSTDWRTIRPTVLVIEATRPWSNKLANADWEPVLLAHGYRRVWFDGINCFYVPAERHDLLRHFTLPINVLDDWVPFDHDRVRLEAQYDSLDVELQAALEGLRQVKAEAEAAVHARAISEAQRDSLDVELQAALEGLRQVKAEAEAAVHARAISEAQRDSLDVELQAALEGLRQVKAEAEAAVHARAALVGQLVYELRWPDGPRALRAVLSMARLIRRLVRTPVPAALSNEVNLAGSETARDTTLLLPLSAQLERPIHLKRFAKQLARVLYRPARPVLRPIAWRTRTFMTSEVRSDLARLEAKLDRLSTKPPASEEPAVGATVIADTGEIVRMMETTLLTLALDPRREGG